MAKKRSPSTSINSAMQRRALAGQIPDVPKGLKLKTAAEREIWAQFGKMRLVTDWRPSDLIQLHELVQIEVKVRELCQEIEDEGAYQKGPSGWKEHPRVTYLDKWRRQKFAILRGLGLTVPTTGDTKSYYRNNAPTEVDEAAAKKVASGRPSLKPVPG